MLIFRTTALVHRRYCLIVSLSRWLEEKSFEEGKDYSPSKRETSNENNFQLQQNQTALKTFVHVFMNLQACIIILFKLKGILLLGIPVICRAMSENDSLQWFHSKTLTAKSDQINF